MSIRFKNSRRGAVRAWVLSGLAWFCLASSTTHARPIEFSEPAGSNLTANVSGLGVKPADLPSVEDRVFRPHSYNSTRDAAYNMKPLTTPPGPVNPMRNRPPGPFDRDQNWMQMAPDKMLQKMLERDALKLPSFETGDNSSDAWSAWDPYNLKSFRRNGTGKNESRGRSQVTNRLDNAADVLNASDPFAPFSGRRGSFDESATPDLNAGRTRGFSDLPRSGAEFSPEALERKQQADHLEEFKRTLNFQTPGMNPVLPAPGFPPARGNGFVSEMDNFSRSPARAAMPQWTPPTAPLAPQSPLAPGQTSLTPSPYSPPAKLKPVNVTAPRRSF